MKSKTKTKTKTKTKMKTKTEEIRYLGQMLTASSATDRKRLRAILAHLAQLLV